ncbi:MAG: GDSL-type esterase/lipase family protein [Mucinivorans sp.]
MKRIVLFLGLVFLSFATCFASKPVEKQSLAIVFIGNSITQGALMQNPVQDAPPAQTAVYLQAQEGVGSVNFANCGVSGCTTVDYLPASNTLFAKAQQSADKLNVDGTAQLIFSIMLGTNDSAVKGPNGAPVSPVQYRTNIKVIVDELMSLYPHCLVVLHRPLWYSPNTYNSAVYLAEGLQRVERYLPELESLVSAYATSNPQRVYMGDKDGFDYFKVNYLTDLVAESGNAGTFYLHPTVQGATRLSQFWGQAIMKSIQSKIN